MPDKIENGSPLLPGDAPAEKEQTLVEPQAGPGEAAGEDKGKPPSFFATFNRVFPVKDLAMGYIAPKVIFHHMVHNGHLLGAAVVSAGWCIAVSAFQYARNKKIDCFALLALVMILARSAALMAKGHPILYTIAEALDSGIIGVIFVGSVLMGRPIIQMFVDAMGMKEIPDRIRKSPYYPAAWRIVTLTWGLVNLAQAILLPILKVKSPGLAPAFDFISSWPTTMALMSFSIWFPGWYWRKNIDRMAP